MLNAVSPALRPYPLSAAFSTNISRPSAHRVSPLDTVRFSGTQTLEQVVYIAEQSRYNQELTLSPEFKANAQAGVRLFWQSLPSALRQRMLNAGYRVHVAPTPMDGLRDVHDFFPPRDMALIRKYMRQYPNHPRGTESPGNFVQDFFMTTESRLPPNLTRMTDPQLTDLYNAFFLERLAAYAAGGVFGDSPVCLERTGLVILPEQTFAFMSTNLWNDRPKPPEMLARTVRHESCHFIDFILGKEQTDRHFSQAKDFRRAVLDDRHQAIRQGSWPAAGGMNTDELFFGTPMSHYFPGRRALSEQPDSAFQEVFAEVTASLLGGGPVDPRYVQAVYPRTTRWVALRLRELEQGRPQPGSFMKLLNRLLG